VESCVIYNGSWTVIPLRDTFLTQYFLVSFLDLRTIFAEVSWNFHDEVSSIDVSSMSNLIMSGLLLVVSDVFVSFLWSEGLTILIICDVFPCCCHWSFQASSSTVQETFNYTVSVTPDQQEKGEVENRRAEQGRTGQERVYFRKYTSSQGGLLCCLAPLPSASWLPSWLCSWQCLSHVSSHDDPNSPQHL
jgi:hypothetical protein